MSEKKTTLILAVRRPCWIEPPYEKSSYWRIFADRKDIGGWSSGNNYPGDGRSDYCRYESVIAFGENTKHMWKFSHNEQTEEQIYTPPEPGLKIVPAQIRQFFYDNTIIIATTFPAVVCVVDLVKNPELLTPDGRVEPFKKMLDGMLWCDYRPFMCKTDEEAMSRVREEMISPLELI